MNKMLSRLVSLSLFVSLFMIVAACGSTQAGTPEETSLPPEGFTSTPSENAMINLKSGFDHSKFFPSDSGTTGYFYVEAKAAKFSPVGKQRTPLNISVVIDHSGSMEGDKLTYAKKAAKFIVDQLAEEDFISIVKYDDDVTVVSKSARLTDKESLRRRIDGIEADGSTNLHGGMMEGYAQVKSTFKQGYINRVLLLSDGLANVGITDQGELQRIAKAQNIEHGITLSTFGIGIDFNEDLMTGLSEYGSGNYYFIKDPEMIPSIFERELKGLLNVVAQNAVLTIDLPSGIVLDKLFAYKYEQSGNRISVNFRDIFSEETKAVMLRFKVQDTKQAQFAFHSTLTYNDATTEAKPGLKLENTQVLALAETPADRAASRNEDIMAQAVLFESNDKLEQAMREADLGNYQRARDLTDENAGFLRANKEYVDKSEELQRQESTNVQYQSAIKNAEEMSEVEIKTMQKSSKSINYDVRKKR